MAGASIHQQQLQVLNGLLNTARNTRFGRKYGFARLEGYEAFAGTLPLQAYKDLLPYINAAKEGRPDVLWPGVVHQFAVSAGTTGEGKHLPLGPERLESDRRFSRMVIASYLKQRPNIFRLAGRQLSLPGTLENHEYQGHTLQMGEISGFLAHVAPRWLRPLQVVNPKTLTNLPFSQKFERVLEAGLKSDVRVITAVPSWILTLFREALRRTGKNSIAEVWPNLKLLVCGGVKLDNYREALQGLCGPLRPDFVENYGASEGYFAYADRLNRRDLCLVIDNGLFYEWLPYPGKGEHADPVPTWQVQPGVPYAMIVSSNAGLWRYRVNDIVEFTRADEPRIRVVGRVSEMLDDYGEAVYGSEAARVLLEAAAALGLSCSRWTLGALPGPGGMPGHHWMIRFEASRPGDEELRRFAKELDRKLCALNRHYAIRRESGALEAPIVHPVPEAAWRRWMKQTGRNRAQSKIPRILSNTGDLKKLIALSES